MEPAAYLRKRFNLPREDSEELVAAIQSRPVKEVMREFPTIGPDTLGQIYVELERKFGLRPPRTAGTPMKPSANRVAKEWKNLPKNWTQESVKKFWDSLTDAAPKHKVTKCIKQMEGKIGDPGAFCAGLADEMIPGWRQEAAKERAKKAGPLSLQPDYGTSEAALPRGEEPCPCRVAARLSQRR